ncbi:MAG TPA: VOC family protein [Candidatus Paceibacterota bacterium]
MNRVVHFEIHASDVEKLKKFYSDVFGWEMQRMGAEYGNYVLVMTGPGPDEMVKGGVKMEDMGINGGMMMRNAPKAPEGVGPNAFVCIVGVDDIDAYIEKAKKAGGTMHMEKMDVPHVGQLAYFTDPDGNLFGIIEPAPMPAQQ